MEAITLVIVAAVLLTSSVVIFFQNRYKKYSELQDKRIEALNLEVKRLNTNIDKLVNVLKINYHLQDN